MTAITQAITTKNTVHHFTVKTQTLLGLFIIAPFFMDQIQGFLKLVLLSNFPASLLFKSIYICLFLLFLLKYNKLNEVVITLAMTLIFIASLISNISQPIYFIDNISMVAKLIYFPISFFFFREIFSRNNYDENFVFNILLFLFWALFIAILLSVFGIGASQYGENQDGISIGFSGYFWAGNELGPLAVMFYAYVFNYQIQNNSSVWKLLVTFTVGLTTCLLVATKVSIGGFLIITLIVPWYLTAKNSLVKLKISVIKFYIALLTIGIGIIAIVIYTFWNSLLAYYNRLISLYEKSDTLLNFLSSGRDKRVNGALDIYIHDYNWFEKIFGAGEWYKAPLAATLNKSHILAVSVEIDPLDLLLNVGLFGAVLVLYFWLYCFYQSLKISLDSKVAHEGVPFLIMIFFLSTAFSAGHIITSSLLCFYLAVVLAFSSAAYKKKKVGSDIYDY